MIDKGKVQEIIVVILRVCLGFIFVYASLDKIFQPDKFARVIYNYRLVPVETVNIFAIIVPWLELIIGFLLLLGIWVETAAFIMSVLTLAFIFMIASAIFRGLNIECGCFTLKETGSIVSWRRIIEDVFILASGILLFCYELKAKLSEEK